MPDHVGKRKRREIMSKVGSKGSGLERKISAALLRHGVRHHLNVRGLPGTPDIVVGEIMLALFAHGCFWHGCAQHYRQPKSRQEFWKRKVESNVVRDARNQEELRAMGWRVMVLWEHETEERFDSVARSIRSEIES